MNYLRIGRDGVYDALKRQQIRNVRIGRKTQNSKGGLAGVSRRPCRMNTGPGPKEGPLGYVHGIRRLGDKRYRIVYDVPPSGGRPRKQKRETLVGVTKKEAEATRAKRIEEVATGRYVKDDDMTFTGIVREVHGSEEVSRARSNDPGAVSKPLRLSPNPRVREEEVKELKQSHLVNQYVQWLKKGSNGRSISARTIRHAHETLRNALNYAVRMEYVHRNVAALISSDDLPKVVNPKPKALTKYELAKLLTEAQNPTSR